MLRKRLAHNFGANLYTQFVNVIVQLGSVPLFLAFWSKERYGIWILISQIPDCLVIGEAGFATSAANKVSMAMAKGDREEALRSLHTTWGFLLAVSAILSGAGIVSFFLIPWQRWIQSSETTVNEVRWTVLFFVFLTIAGILLQIFQAIYRADHKNARFTVLTTSGKLAEMIAMGLAVMSIHSMVWAIGLMFIIRSLTFVVLFADARNFSGYLPLGLNAFAVAELQQSWRPSVMFMASTLGRAIYIQGLTLLVGATIGAAGVIVFNTTRTISRVIVQFVGMIQFSIWPEFSYLFGIGDFIRARRLNGLSIEVAWLASVVLAGILFLVAPWFIPLWTHHALKFDPALMLIFLTSAILNALWSVTAGLLMGTNQHEALTAYYVMAATASFVIAAMTVHSLGVYGVGLAMIVCDLTVLPFAISRSCRLLSQPVKELILTSIQLRVLRQLLAEYSNRFLVKA